MEDLKHKYHCKQCGRISQSNEPKKPEAKCPHCGAVGVLEEVEGV